MNQVTNLIQWKNHTDEQKKDFDFENYKYEWQTSSGVFIACAKSDFSLSVNVYRLVIDHDKWYTYSIGESSKTIKGSELARPHKAICLRPAKPDEIPQQEKTLEQKIQDKWPDKEVVMLTLEKDMLRIFLRNIGGSEYDRPHIFAQSMKGFYKYVYEQGNDLISSLKTLKSWKGKTLQPVAVLFER